MHARGGFVDLCAYNFNSSMQTPNLFLSSVIIIEYDIIVCNGRSVGRRFRYCKNNFERTSV